jgi:hypothetical protein
MTNRGREIAKASAWFVLGGLTMLLAFVFMVIWYGR